MDMTEDIKNEKETNKVNAPEVAENEKDAVAEPQSDDTTNEATADGETNTSEIEEAQKEIEQLKDKYLRTVAEFDNYKKRTLKEKAELLLNGSEKAISSILPILDDFERAIADKTEAPSAMKEGVMLIYNKFVKTLESLGVKKIETEGKDFDVDFHEAVALVPGMGDDKKGKVIDCVQTGYKLNDKVIRHAKVAVGQ